MTGRLLLVGALLACDVTPSAPHVGVAVPAVPVAPGPVTSHVASPSTHEVAEWVRAYDDPARDSWQRPEVLVAAMDITPGSTVADVGAGTGYFTAHLARAVGPTGRVVAVDIEPALIAHLRERAVAEGTPQVEARLARPDDPALRPGEVDRVLLVDTYGYIEGRPTWFRALVPAMKPQGRLVIVDFPPGDAPHGPPAAERVDPEAVVTLLEQTGWALVDRPNLLPEQFVLIFTPA